jgi:hypothetical protein
MVKQAEGNPPGLTIAIERRGALVDAHGRMVDSSFTG